jgi:hypothetical protein
MMTNFIFAPSLNMLCILRFSVTKESIVWEVLATNRNIRARRLVIDFFSAVLLTFDSYKKEEDGANGCSS